MAVILVYQGKINQCANTVQGVLEIVVLWTVRISQCRLYYGQNTVAEVPHFLTLPLSDFPIGLFRYAESRIGRNFIPGIVECLLPCLLFQEPLFLLHYMFE